MRTVKNALRRTPRLFFLFSCAPFAAPSPTEGSTRLAIIANLGDALVVQALVVVVAVAGRGAAFENIRRRKTIVIRRSIALERALLPRRRLYFERLCYSLVGLVGRSGNTRDGTDGHGYNGYSCISVTDPAG